MAEKVLSVQNLVKDYKGYRAVDGISFDVLRGQVLGFLGPNGAGKTTTIQILIGVTNPTSGTIEYFERDFKSHREDCLSRINFTSAFNTLLGRISVWENLLVYANLYQVASPEKKIRELGEYFELGEIYKSVYWNLSAGQRTRVNLVKALLNDPELILMDEPTASLDPDVADKTLTLIEQMQKDKNLSILYTSHNMNEITRICDEVIFLDHGKIVARDTPTNLTKRIQEATLRMMIIEGKEKAEAYLSHARIAFTQDEHHHVDIKVTEKQIPQIIIDIGNTGAVITDLEIKKPNLEDVFLEIARG